MAEEEFQESDVVFRETDDETAAARSLPVSCRETRIGRRRSRSVPVNIPASAPRNAWLDGGDDGEMVPPHVIIGRRVAGKMMELSICGRILKGRDLSEFRNLILRMTGFLETWSLGKKKMWKERKIIYLFVLPSFLDLGRTVIVFCYRSSLGVNEFEKCP